MMRLFANTNSRKNFGPVNYHCPVCQSTGRTPNIAGRFFIINLTQCKCNGCSTVFEKTRFYKQVVFDVTAVV